MLLPVAGGAPTATREAQTRSGRIQVSLLLRPQPRTSTEPLQWRGCGPSRGQQQQQQKQQHQQQQHSSASQTHNEVKTVAAKKSRQQSYKSNC